MLFIFVASCVDSLSFYYFAVSMTVMLLTRGATTLQVGLVQLAAYPSCFKFLAAPLVDTYYVQSIGRRKTYIFLSLLITTVIFLLASFHIDGWIQNLEIDKIFILGFSSNFTKTFYDVSLRGWMVTTLKQGIYGKGAAY